MSRVVEGLRSEVVPLHAALLVIVDDFALVLESVDGFENGLDLDAILLDALDDLFRYVALAKPLIAEACVRLGLNVSSVSDAIEALRVDVEREREE